MTGFYVQHTDHTHNDHVSYVLEPENPFGSSTWGPLSMRAHEFATRGGARNFIKKKQAEDRLWPARRTTYRIVKSDSV